MRHPLVQKIVKAYEEYETKELVRQNKTKERKGRALGGVYPRKPK